MFEPVCWDIALLRDIVHTTMAVAKRKNAEEGKARASVEAGSKVRRTLKSGKAAAEVQGKSYDKKKQLRVDAFYVDYTDEYM